MNKNNIGGAENVASTVGIVSLGIAVFSAGVASLYSHKEEITSSATLCFAGMVIIGYPIAQYSQHALSLIDVTTGTRFGIVAQTEDAEKFKDAPPIASPHGRGFTP